MFEFKHNFRLVNFINCMINNNKGFFLEMIPKETKTLQMFQKIRFFQTKFYNHTGRTNAMIHVTQNSQLEVENCEFIENYSFGRGGIVYSEFENSKAMIINTKFIRNSGF